MKAKRIVFKVGTSSLTNPDGSLSRQKVKVITQQLALLHESGHELILVSSGAVAAGFGALGFKKRPIKVADKQASAAVGQGLLMEEYTSNLLLRNIVSAQILLTQDDFADQRRYKNAHQALSVLLNRGAIPIINENDTVSIAELKVGDNDTLSAQVGPSGSFGAVDGCRWPLYSQSFSGSNSQAFGADRAHFSRDDRDGWRCG